jgi:hypothetical protein
MMNHEENNNTHLTVSHELLLLLQWLITHEEKKLQKIIQKAMNSGLHLELDNHSKKKEYAAHHDLSGTVGDFFSLLEDHLTEAVNQNISHNQHLDMVPALDKIDSTVCDSDIIKSSLEKASTEFAKNPEKKNAHEILFHELLKNWKPDTKIMN